MASGESSDSEQELHDIIFPQNSSAAFIYDDPLLVSGVLQAVIQADLSKIKELVVSGKSPNINDNHGNTPLHVAVIKNFPEIVDFLLTCEEVNVNGRNFYGETALFLAVKRGHLNSVEKLIKSNSNVNLPNFEDVTPLHISVKFPDIAKILVLSGAKIDAIDYSGETPLHEAITEKNSEVVCMLLYYGADANIACCNGITPFMKAVLLENIEVQTILLDYVTDFNAVTKDGMTLLNLVLTHSSPYTKVVIDRGADVNYKHMFLNAFVMCIEVPNTYKFSLVWKDLKYQKLYTNLTYLEQIIISLEESKVYEFLRIIIDSNNLSPLFENFEFFPLYNFVLNVMDKNAWSHIVYELLFLYASSGYSLNSDLICQLFELYGYTELFYCCLHMDIEPSDSNYQSFARFLYDTKLPTKRFPSVFAGWLENFATFSLKEFLLFVRFPRLTLRSWEIRDEDKKKLCQLPSLLEMSRNATRDYLITRFCLYESKQYYLFLQNMPVANVYKDILSFKLPVYAIKR